MSAVAQTLWHNTRAGMSVDQVRALVPEAQSVTNNSKENGLHVGSQLAPELLHVENFSLLNHSFSASFYFLDNHLYQITLKDEDTQEIDKTYDNLVVALNAKYGKALEFSRKDDALATTRKALWLCKRTSVKLLLMKIGSDDPHPLLNVFYKVDLANEVDKL